MAAKTTSLTPPRLWAALRKGHVLVEDVPGVGKTHRAGQAWAALDGRDFVIPDDIQQLIPFVLEHRLVLDLDRELRGATRQAVLDDVLAQTPVPLAESA